MMMLRFHRSNLTCWANRFYSIAKTFVRFAGKYTVTRDPGSLSGADFDPGSRIWIPASAGMTSKTAVIMSVLACWPWMAKWTLFLATVLEPLATALSPSASGFYVLQDGRSVCTCYEQHLFFRGFSLKDRDR
jgi:hypothetical protein